MKKYTKLFLATLCFISSAPVLAGHHSYKGEMAPLMPVTIPNFNGGFEFTIGAVDLRPTTTNTDYLAVHTTATSAVTGVTTTVHNWSDFDVDQDYDWGFVLGLGYVFPNSANDLRFDWLSFDNSYSDHTDVDGSGGFTTDVIFWPGGPDSTAGTTLLPTGTLNASAKASYDLDVVDFTLGQYVNIGSRLQTRLFAGLRYMRLEDELTTNYVFPTASVATSLITGEIESNFNGIGPLFGIKGNYYLGSGFGLSGSFDAALLVGDVDLSASQTENNFVTTTSLSVLTRNFDWDDTNVVAPGFDGKFGLTFGYQCNNGTMINLELGYQVSKYIDVVGEMERGDVIDGDNYDHELSNFGLNGPYLTLNLKV